MEHDLDGLRLLAVQLRGLALNLVLLIPQLPEHDSGTAGRRDDRQPRRGITPVDPDGAQMGSMPSHLNGNRNRCAEVYRPGDLLAHGAHLT